MMVVWRMENLTENKNLNGTSDVLSDSNFAATLDVVSEEITVNKKQWKEDINGEMPKNVEGTMRDGFVAKNKPDQQKTPTSQEQSPFKHHTDSFSSTASIKCNGDFSNQEVFDESVNLDEISLGENNDIEKPGCSGDSPCSRITETDGKTSELLPNGINSDNAIDDHPLRPVNHTARQSFGNIFEWISSKSSPKKKKEEISPEKLSQLEKPNHQQVAELKTKSTASVSKIKSRRSKNCEPLSTTALILENRPRNLPQKPFFESEKHRIEYEKMIEQVRKSELKEIKKKNQQIKLQHKQEEIIKNTSLIWSNEILPNWSTTHNTSKVRQLWWEGLPPKVRGKVWQLAISNELNITRDLFEIMVTRAHDKLKSMHETQSFAGEETESLTSDRESTVELISLDISRTFPTLCIFQKGGPYHNVLHDILGAYVCYRPDVGYVQGMSFIAAMLLLNMEASDAFATFANLLNKPCQRTFFQLNEDAMKVYFAAFEVFFEENLPKLFAHFKQNNLSPDMYLIDWIFTMFSKTLSFDTACRVWDIFCRDGEEFLFKCAIALLRLHEDQLLEMEFIQAAQFLTRMPPSLCTHQQLFRHIYDVTMVSRGSRRWRDVLSLLEGST